MCADALFESAITLEDAVARFVEVTGAIQELVVRKRAYAGDDLTSALVQSHEGDDRYTQDELVETVHARPQESSGGSMT